MLSSKFSKAFLFANQLHFSQTRNGTSLPYISHLMSVAAIVMESGGTQDEVIAGLLHDAIEDQGPSFSGGSDGLRKEILTRFGSTVLNVIEECTDADTLPKPDWKPRKEAYIKHLESVSSSGALVSCADKVHNVRSILRDYEKSGEDVWSRFSANKEDILWYYQSLRSAFNKIHSIDTSLRDTFDNLVSQLSSVILVDQQ